MPEAPAKPMFLVYRKLGTLTYSAFSQTQTIDLDRLHGLRFVDLHVDVQWDGSGGTADGALLTGAPFHFLNEIRLKGNGKDDIIRTTGHLNYQKNNFDYAVAPASTLPAVSGTGAANYAFNFISRLDLAMPNGLVPIDTALISALFATLQLSVTIGSKTDIVNATNDRVVAFDTCTIDVYVGEILNFEADKFGRIIAKQGYQEIIPSATGSNLDLQLAVGNAYRDFLVEAVAPSTNPTPNNSVLDNIQISAGAEIFYDGEDDIARRIPALERGVGEQTGIYFIDMSRDGLIRQTLNASLFNNLKFRFANTLQTGNRVRVLSTELVPV